MNSRWIKVGLVLIIILALGVRLYRLGSIPDGLTWDEAAIGYNGYSVWQIHRDEWLNFMPLSFRSFGDYKAPAAIYISGLFTSLLGLSPLAVRVPFALAGVSAVIGMFGLLKTVLHSFDQKESAVLSSTTLALIGTLFLACSPWHILFSRVGFESGMALSCVIWATWLLLLSQRKRTSQPHWVSIGLLTSASLLFSLSPYLYHSAKVFTPVFVLFLVVLLLKNKLISVKKSLLFLLLFGVGLVPLVYDSLFGHALERGGVSVFSQSASLLAAVQALLAGFWAHLLPSFLLWGATDNLRHSTSQYGVLSPLHFGLLLAAVVIVLIALVRRTRFSHASLAVLSIIWILVGILPAAIGVEVPHPNRALMALAGFILLSIWTIIQLSALITQAFKNTTAQRLITVLVLVLIVGEVVSVLFFSNLYFGRYQHQLSDAYLSGYLEAARLAYDYSIGKNHTEVDQVVFTSTYGQPYIFMLFANQLDSIAYHNGVLVKFLFPDKVTIGDLDRINALVVAGKADMIDAKPDTIIADQNGDPRFYFYLSHGTE